MFQSLSTDGGGDLWSRLGVGWGVERKEKKMMIGRNLIPKLMLISLYCDAFPMT